MSQSQSFLTYRDITIKPHELIECKKLTDKKGKDRILHEPYITNGLFITMNKVRRYQLNFKNMTKYRN